MHAVKIHGLVFALYHYYIVSRRRDLSESQRHAHPVCVLRLGQPQRIYANILDLRNGKRGICVYLVLPDIFTEPPKKR